MKDYVKDDEFVEEAASDNENIEQSRPHELHLTHDEDESGVKDLEKQLWPKYAASWMENPQMQA